jgi:hypothetical protein
MSSGGGGDKKSSGSGGSTTPTTKTYGALPSYSTIAPGIGDQTGMIAAQLGAGFGGAAPALDFYKPTQQLNLAEPMTQTQAALKGSKDSKRSPFAAPLTGNPMLDLLLLGKTPGSKTTSGSGGSIKDMTDEEWKERYPNSYAKYHK